MSQLDIGMALAIILLILGKKGALDLIFPGVQFCRPPQKFFSVLEKALLTWVRFTVSI